MEQSEVRWEPIWKMASSKWVWWQRITGWIVLLLIVGSWGYGVFLIISSRNQKHVEQVLQINTSVTAWNRTYVSDVNKWLPSLVNDKKDAFPFDKLNTPDFASQFSDVTNYTVVKYYLADIRDAFKLQSTKVIGNPDNGEFNITTNFTIAYDNGQSTTVDC